MCTRFKLRSDLKRESFLAAFLGALGLTLSFIQGCAAPDPAHRADGNSPVSRDNLPFHSETLRPSGGDGVRPEIPADRKSVREVPFRGGAYSRTVPSGTFLTVQLGHSLSTANIQAGNEFAAAVATPVTVDGETLIDRGMAVTGHIESAQTVTNRTPALGYFRLTLDTISVNGKPLPLQTSSLFTPSTILPSNVSSRSNCGRVQKGRRLTFRLVAPVLLDDKRTTPDRRPADLTTP